MNFDKSNWTTVCLADVADEISVRVDNPSDTEFDRFVGLEHFNSGELKIHRWGSTQDLVSAMKLFQAGDILIARRNVYLKRASLVDFDGVCSGDAVVLREKKKGIVDGYLTFVLNTEDFWKYAIANADGSMSKRINVKNLLKYTFRLPPIEKQRRISELLWTTEKCRQQYSSVYYNAEILYRTFVNDWVEKNINNTTPFAELWSRSPQNGCSAPESSKETNYYVLGLSALTKVGYQSGNIKRVVPTEKMLNAKLNKGDFLVSRSNTSDLVGLVGIYNEDTDNVSFPDTMMRLQIDTSRALLPYLEVMLLSDYGRKQMKSICAGTSHSMKKINRKTLGEIKIPLVTVDHQLLLMRSVYRFTEVLNACMEHEKHYASLIQSQISNLVGGVSDV